ncbi:MAG: thiamine phosphate synthase [Propionibacteriaceae bacterium]|nr:thiamine phosphate synthase [Propionibacteriaceae bacterium]
MTFLSAPAARLRSAKLLFITGLELPAPLPGLVAAGVNIVTITDDTRSDAQLIEALGKLHRSIAIDNALFGIRERPDVAYQADFFHLASPRRAEIIKSALPLGILLGCTCETRAEFDEALATPAIDYLWVGPANNDDLIAHACWMAPQSNPASKIWFATGGVNKSNVAHLLDVGVRRIGCSRAISMATDPLAAALAFSDAVKQAWTDDPAMDAITQHATNAGSTSDYYG